MRTGLGAAAAEADRARTAVRTGAVGAMVSAFVVGASLWLPSSPVLALTGTAAMVPVFGGLLQVAPRSGLTWACGGLVLANTLFLLFISEGAAFQGAFAISRAVGMGVMALMLVLHLRQRARIQAPLVLLALLADLAGFGGLAIVFKGLWLLALGMWLGQKVEPRKDDPRTLGEAIDQ